VSEEVDALERAALAQAPPGAVVVGSSISPDRQHAVTLTILPTASDYAMDDLFERVDDHWEPLAGGGGGGGTTWWSFPGRGVLSYGGAAPADSTFACIAFEGCEYRVRVRHGYFLLAVWDTNYSDEPRLIGFD
jgi:hypothetical protein